ALPSAGGARHPPLERHHGLLTRWPARLRRSPRPAGRLVGRRLHRARDGLRLPHGPHRRRRRPRPRRPLRRPLPRRPLHRTLTRQAPLVIARCTPPHHREEPLLLVIARSEPPSLVITRSLPPVVIARRPPGRRGNL